MQFSPARLLPVNGKRPPAACSGGVARGLGVSRGSAPLRDGRSWAGVSVPPSGAGVRGSSRSSQGQPRFSSAAAVGLERTRGSLRFPLTRRGVGAVSARVQLPPVGEGCARARGDPPPARRLELGFRNGGGQGGEAFPCQKEPGVQRGMFAGFALFFLITFRAGSVTECPAAETGLAFVFKARNITS